MKAVWQYLRDLWRRKDLLLYLVTSGLKADTRNTFLGYFWWLLDPALYVLVFVFVRVVLIGRAGEDIVPFLATGLVVFQFFAQTLTGSARSITSKSGIITQVYLPKAMLPVSVVLTQLANFAFSLVTLAVILGLSGIVPGVELLWLPYLIVVQTLFQIAIALAIAYVAAFIRDIDRVLSRIVMIMRFTAPVLWEGSRLPNHLDWLVDYNPLAWLLEAYRAILMYGRQPSIRLMTALGLVSAMASILLVVFYTYNEHRIVKAL
ncbi:MAG: ABC transporter permease [Spirochaetota bacterium]